MQQFVIDRPGKQLVIALKNTDAGVLVHARLEYVWRESEKIGDSSRVAIELGIRDGLISSWHLEDEPDVH